MAPRYKMLLHRTTAKGDPQGLKPHAVKDVSKNCHSRVSGNLDIVALLQDPRLRGDDSKFLGMTLSIRDDSDCGLAPDYWDDSDYGVAPDYWDDSDCGLAPNYWDDSDFGVLSGFGRLEPAMLLISLRGLMPSPSDARTAEIQADQSVSAGL